MGSTIIPSKAYDILKFIALVLLPAFGALYYGLAAIWGLPNSEQVVGTTVVIDAFLGAILKASNVQYEKSDRWADGEMIVQSEDGVPYRMEANLKNIENPMEIANQDRVVFKVTNENSGMQV